MAMPKDSSKEISSIYRKIESGLHLDADEEKAVSLFETEHPLLRTFLTLDYETLYEKVSRAEEADLTLKMLRFLLLHYFDVDSKSRRKADLLNELKQHIYNAGYNPGYMD